MTILDDIVEYKKKEVALAKANAPYSAVEALAREAGAVRGFSASLERNANIGYALIAEIKKASPSKGVIRDDFSPKEHASAYERGGATCLSVLTDEPSFKGSLNYLREAREACRLPILRKDFIVDPYQVAEARAWAADCILLILACLSDQQTSELTATAREYGMDVLVEVHNEDEIDRALKAKAKLIGINNRNLNTFKTSLETTRRLSSLIPLESLIVSESGITTHQDLVDLAAYGVKAFLVGESLMRSQNIELATRSLLAGEQTA